MQTIYLSYLACKNDTEYGKCYSRHVFYNLPAHKCIEPFHWLILLLWPIRFDVTIVCTGNSCKL